MFFDRGEDAVDVPGAGVGAGGVIVGKPGFAGVGVARAVAGEVEDEEVAAVGFIEQLVEVVLDALFGGVGILEVGDLMGGDAGVAEVFY